MGRQRVYATDTERQAAHRQRKATTMVAELVANHRALLAELATVMAEAAAIAAPYDAQIQALEIAKADALGALTFQAETLKAALRPLILEYGQTVIAEGIRASYVQKQTWDADTLQEMAKEIPAILQCVRETPYVTFRATKR